MAKYCGNCGKEVDRKAVVCVNCGRSLKKTSDGVHNSKSVKILNDDKKGLPAWAIVLIVLGSLLVLGVILFFGILLAAFSYFTEEGYNDIKDVYSDIRDDFEDEFREERSHTLRGTVRDTLDTDNYSLTLLNYKTMDVIETTYSAEKAVDGKEFLVLYFRVKNNSDKSFYVSDYDFSGYENDRKIDNKYLYYKIEGFSPLNDSVASGKYIEGYLVYEVSREWEDFEIHFIDKRDYYNKTEMIFDISNIDEDKD